MIVRLNIEEMFRLEEVLRQRCKPTDKPNCKMTGTLVAFSCDDGTILLYPAKVAEYINQHNLVKLRPGMTLTRSNIDTMYRTLSLIHDYEKPAKKAEPAKKAPSGTKMIISPGSIDDKLIDTLNKSTIAKSLESIARSLQVMLSNYFKQDEPTKEIEIRAKILKAFEDKKWLQAAPKEMLQELAANAAKRLASGEKLTHDMIDWNVSHGKKQALLLLAANVAKWL